MSSFDPNIKLTYEELREKLTSINPNFATVTIILVTAPAIPAILRALAVELFINEEEYPEEQIDFVRYHFKYLNKNGHVDVKPC